MNKEKYYDLHRACPVCYNTKVRSTQSDVPEQEGEPFEDRVNVVTCWNPSTSEGCGWSGRVRELVPDPKVDVTRTIFHHMIRNHRNPAIGRYLDRTGPESQES